MSNKKAQTCSKTILGYQRVAKECLFVQKWGKIFQMEVRTFVRKQGVIWHHLMAFKADIIQKQLTKNNIIMSSS